MKALVQRVASARVDVGCRTVGQIDAGLLALVCAVHGDTETQADRLLDRLLKLRVFADERGRMNRSLQDIDGRGTPGGLLLVSQFTLAADTSGGNRPSFTAAADPGQALVLYRHLLQCAAARHAGRVAAGEFGAHMDVHLVNDGPVTLPLDVPPPTVP